MEEKKNLSEILAQVRKTKSKTKASLVYGDISKSNEVTSMENLENLNTNFQNQNNITNSKN